MLNKDILNAAFYTFCFLYFSIFPQIYFYILHFHFCDHLGHIILEDCPSLLEVPDVRSGEVEVVHVPRQLRIFSLILYPFQRIPKVFEKNKRCGVMVYAESYYLR